MNLLDILSERCVKVPLEASDKRSAIEELVGLLASADLVTDADALNEAVWTREQTRTTGIGHGLAIPHGKSDSIREIAMAIGKPAEPMEFEAIDKQPVKLIVLLASPPDKTSEHIQALARVSRLMNTESFRKEMYGATNAGEVWALLQQQEQTA